MLAHDAPTKYVDMWGEISLPEYLDSNRSGKGWGKSVTAWHITTRDRLPGIMSDGLRGSTCSQHISSGNDRPYATYLFCARSVVEDNIPALLDNTDTVILKVIIPANHMHKMHPDNLYNMSVDAAQMSAIQYRDDIPASWITEE